MKILVKPPQSELKKKNPKGKLIAKSSNELDRFHLLSVSTPHTVMKPKTDNDSKNIDIETNNPFVGTTMFNPVKVMANGIR